LQPAANEERRMSRHSKGRSTKSFLPIVKRALGEGNYAGDEHGGGAGHDGSGMPTGKPGNFMFATGIECSNPTIDHGRTRRDLLAECGHYERWREDLALTRELGLLVLRYGLPIHKTFLGPGKYDWEFADLVMGEMRRLGITRSSTSCISGCLTGSATSRIPSCRCCSPAIAMPSPSATRGCAITRRSTRFLSPPSRARSTASGTSSSRRTAASSPR
jgi:hypothetical protein